MRIYKFLRISKIHANLQICANLQIRADCKNPCGITYPCSNIIFDYIITDLDRLEKDTDFENFSKSVIHGFGNGFR